MKSQFLTELNKLSPKNDVRYYLSGVHVFSCDGRLCFEVTDGHIMARVIQEKYSGADIDLIISRSSLDRYKMEKDFPVEIVKKDNFSAIISCAGIDYSVELIDGVFPDIDRIIPRYEHKESPATYNPDYLSVVAKAWRAMFGRKKDNLKIVQYGEAAPCMMQHLEDGYSFSAAIMPARIKSEDVGRSFAVMSQSIRDSIICEKELREVA
jgi:DNA polymerase III subunit beta